MSEWQHKPEGGGGGEKQFLIYLFFAFVMVLLFQMLFVKPQPKRPEQQQANQQTQTKTAPAQAPAATTESMTAPTQQAASESEIVVENDLYRVAFTNRGAQVKSWVLKKYKDEKGNPLDLVNQQASAKFGMPLSLWTYDENLRSQINNALYVPKTQGCKSAQGANLDESEGAKQCSFSGQLALTFDYSSGGLVVHKKLTFTDSYLLGLETSAARDGQPVAAFPAWPSAFGDQIKPTSFNSGRIDWETPEGVSHSEAFEHNIIRPNKWVANGDTVRRTFNWTGISDQYFAAIFLPAKPSDTTVITLNQPLELAKDPTKPIDKDNSVTVNVLGLAAGNPSGTTQARLFVGPKDVDILKTIHANAGDGAALRGPSLEGAINWGFFGVFAKWLFMWLNWTHDHWVANWGWSILILTLVITIVILPLRLQQMKTSLKMQKVQPRVQAINKKYEKYSLRDTEKQQEKQAEVMALYKEAGINPMSMGGCLFMFIQLPLIYAFYEVLESSIALRHAPWLWIRDLTAPDPLHILPLLCIVTMIAMQYMTPMPGMDASQRRMMNVMMVGMFGWFTWAYSAGVAMYLTVSYLISVVQQYFLNRSELGKEIREIQEKRARKAKR